MLKQNGKEIAILESDKLLITDVQSALDLTATVRYESGCDRIILDKSTVTEEFFDLKTKLAGEILQKLIAYHLKIAIIGDFSEYKSNSLRDFIYESNRGRDIFFLPDEKTAVERLSTN